MDAAWKVAIAAAAGVAAVWLALVVVLILQSRRYGRPSLREMLRLLPDLVRLLKRLAADDSLPRRMRVAQTNPATKERLRGPDSRCLH